MTSGFEISLATKTLAPLLGSLAKTATGHISTALSKWKASDYPEKLAQKLSSADRVKTIWSRDHTVSLMESYHPSNIDVKKSRQSINSIAELPHSHVVIEGIVGQGKSMFMQYLYLQEISGAGSGGLPLLILLRTITAKRGLSRHIEEALENLGVDSSKDVFAYLAGKGCLILMLDGFDELDHALVKDTILEIEGLIFKYPTLRVIISSRKNSDIQKSRHLDVVQLSSLKPSDYAPFLKKLGVESVRIAEIILAIEKSPADVSELISTPLMLTLVAYVYASENEIPSELPIFFERLFTTTFLTHDKQKGGGFRRQHYSGLSERKLQLLFEAFCFLTLHKQIGRTLTGDQFSEFFEGAQKLIEGAECLVGNFKLDITKVACLMLDDGFDQTSFLHMSIAEYFSAAFVMRANEKLAAQFYQYAIEHFRNLEVVMGFLEKIDTYRFNKYYVIPPLDKLFLALGSAPGIKATNDKWLSLIKDSYSTFSIGFAFDKQVQLYRMTSIRGSHENSQLRQYGQIFFGNITSMLINTFAEELFTKEFLSNNLNLFKMSSGRGDDIENLLSIAGLIAVFGEDVLLKNIETVELKFWDRYKSAKREVENEDNKTSLISWRL